MRIKIYAVGSIKEKYWVDAIDEYIKRISPYSKIEIIEVDDLSMKGKSDEQIKDKECDSILSKIKPNEFVCNLDLNKKEYDSVSFSSKLMEMIEKGGASLSFVIGGSLGISEKMKQRANESISLSKMTFTHQMSRVILLEQIYRAFKINKGEPYHK
ncbi:MAG: 23S rRNA (pseudouridine(1915)-N(3))-methyltransferase RlmH [Bacilli bacterium]|nr:23S rRNA (pseudouridine(1915)-N(3))-methyltransferase RlmH [Bacilli bacterium]